MIELIVIAGIIIRCFAVILFIFSIMPKQYKEIKIKDGLQFTRWAMFIGLLVCTLAMLENISYNVYRTLFTDNVYFYMNLTALLNSFKDLIIAVIFYLIYHHTYKEDDQLSTTNKSGSDTVS